MDRNTLFLKSFIGIYLLATFSYFFTADSLYPLLKAAKTEICVECPKRLAEDINPGPLAEPEIHHHPQLQAKFRSLSIPQADLLGLIGGAKIIDMQEGPLTANAMIQEGFVITKVNGKSIYSAEDLVRKTRNPEGVLTLQGIYDDLSALHDDLEGEYVYEIEIQRKEELPQM